MKSNNGNNGTQKKMITRIFCAWNENHIIEEDAKKGLFGYKPAEYPERWENIEGEILCPDCAEVAQQSLKQARERCANGGKKRKTPSSD